MNTALQGLLHTPLIYRFLHTDMIRLSCTAESKPTKEPSMICLLRNLVLEEDKILINAKSLIAAAACWNVKFDTKAAYSPVPSANKMLYNEARSADKRFKYDCKTKRDMSIAMLRKMYEIYAGELRAMGDTAAYLAFFYTKMSEDQRCKAIFQNFELPISTTVLCSKGHTSVQVSIENTLSLSTGGADLQGCLERYFASETLAGKNQYECSACKKRVDATQSTKIGKLPAFLVIALKRLEFNKTLRTYEKPRKSIAINDRLQITRNMTTVWQCFF